MISKETPLHDLGKVFRAAVGNTRVPGRRGSALTDIVASLTDISPVADGAVDALFSSHNLEHLYPHEVGSALREFHRVLDTEGIVYLRVPDLQKVAELVAKDLLDDPAYISPAGPIAPLDMLYGLRTALADGNYFMAHKTGFTAKTLRHALQEAGFACIRVQREEFGLCAIAYKI